MNSTPKQLRVVNEAYFALIPAIERLRERTELADGPIGELIAIVSAWADFHAYGAVWIGGELKPCANVLEAIAMRVAVTS